MHNLNITHSIPLATHNVADPVATVASAHWAATVREFDGHKVCMNNPLNADGKSSNGDNAVLRYGIDLLKDGYLQFNGKPGLGITLDEKLVKEKYMVAGETWWDEEKRQMKDSKYLSILFKHKRKKKRVAVTQPTSINQHLY